MPEEEKSLKDSVQCCFDCKECIKTEEECRQDLYRLFHALLREGVKKLKKTKRDASRLYS